MSLFGWSTRQILRASGYVESLFEGRVFTSDVLRGAQDTPDFINLQAQEQDASKALQIMHISDLHFGAAHLDKVDHLKRTLRHLAPHLVVVSGDIVNTPTDENFTLAKDFLDYVSDYLSDHGGYMLVCPGNHDRHGKPDLTAYMDGLGFNRGPHDCKFIKFGDRTWVTAFVFNSTPCQKADDYGLPTPLAESLQEAVEQIIQVRGRIDPSQLDQAKAWRDWLIAQYGDAYRHSLKLAVLHHHPLPTSHAAYDEQFLMLLNGGQVLDCLTELDIDIVFHGHQHDPLIQVLRRGPRDKQMLVLSAGTATKASANGEEIKRVISQQTGFYKVLVSDATFEVEQFSYANAYTLEYKFIPTKRVVSRRAARRFLRHKLETRWVIEWPTTDVVSTEKHTFLASKPDDRQYTFWFGTTTPISFDQLDFSVSRHRDGVPETHQTIGYSSSIFVDSVGDTIHSFEVKIDLDPALSTDWGSDDVLAYTYRWPKGFLDFKEKGTVQSELVYGESMDEWVLEIELVGDGGFEFLMLPCGATPQEGLLEPLGPKKVRYRKVGVPAGLVFTYQITRRGQ